MPSSPRARLVVLLAALVLGLSSPAYAGSSHGSRSSQLPSEDQWVADVKAAMAGPGDQPSAAYWVQKQVDHRNGRKLALNLDIDNTSLATHYDWPHATPHVRWLIRTYQDQGVRMLFNTGRYDDQLGVVRQKLRDAGYKITELCGRHHGETARHSKERCRDRFVNEGYSLIAVIGNYWVDFAGEQNFDQAYRLPNYGGKLL